MPARPALDASDLPSPPAWLRDVPLAHRGLHDAEVPENSLAAFAAAADAGYGAELDVQLSADGVPVVFHDATLTALTGAQGPVERATVDELASLRVLGTSEHVPTLREALTQLVDVPVMVEIKQRRLRAGRLERAVADVLATHGGDWCVASFNPATVRFFRREVPDGVRVLTATHDADPRLPGPVRRRLAELRDLPGCLPHAVSYDLAGLPSTATDAWRARGGLLLTWTAVGEDDVARAAELADNVIFEAARPPLRRDRPVVPDPLPDDPSRREDRP